MRRFSTSRSSMLFSTLTGALLLSLSACALEDDAGELAAAPALEEGSQAVSGKLVRATKAVPGEYLVVLSDGELATRGESIAAVTAELVKAAGGELMYGYDAALKGFAVKMDEAQAKALLADPRVDYVEENGVFELNATQTGATWGLDRIDQAARPLSTTYNYTSTGANVHAYVIDTGIRRAHTQFTGRIGNHFDAITSGGTAEDCQGHGTHVSGTVGGTTHGVAKNVTLHPVRVFSCSGSTTTAAIVAGVNWVTSNRILPAVANMSLGGGASTAMDSAVSNSINAGVTYAIAAGNSSANACNTSPARVAAAITVAASDSSDRHASFSNFGSCVDIYAPGVAVVSSYYTSNTATASLSGTSMASPHVAGVVARLLQAGNQTPAAVASALISTANLNRITGVPSGTPNRLLFRNAAQ
jgi:subtilisin family serine protease